MAEADWLPFLHRKIRDRRIAPHLALEFVRPARTVMAGTVGTDSHAFLAHHDNPDLVRRDLIAYAIGHPLEIDTHWNFGQHDEMIHVRRFRIATVTATTLLYAAPALAHPGHGEPGSSHYFTEPEHVGMLVALVLLSIACVAVGRASLSVQKTRTR